MAGSQTKASTAVDRTRTYHRGGESILVLTQRRTRVLVSIIAVVCVLAPLWNQRPPPSRFYPYCSR